MADFLQYPTPISLITQKIHWECHQFWMKLLRRNILWDLQIDWSFGGVMNLPIIFIIIQVCKKKMVFLGKERVSSRIQPKIGYWVLNLSLRPDLKWKQPGIAEIFGRLIYKNFFVYYIQNYFNLINTFKTIFLYKKIYERDSLCEVLRETVVYRCILCRRHEKIHGKIQVLSETTDLQKRILCSKVELKTHV